MDEEVFVLRVRDWGTRVNISRHVRPYFGALYLYGNAGVNKGDIDKAVSDYGPNQTAETSQERGQRSAMPQARDRGDETDYVPALTRQHEAGKTLHPIALNCIGLAPQNATRGSWN